MSDKGKTLLKGHTLLREGSPDWDLNGVRQYGGRYVATACAKCSCGALSPPGQSIYANRKWHRAHKDSLR